MINVAVYTTGREDTSRLSTLFATGLGRLIHTNVRLERIEDYVSGGLPEDRPDLVVMFGILRGAGDLFRQCRREKVPFIYIDHAYFKPGYETGWFRATRDDHCMNRLEPASPDRWNEYFADDHAFQPWRGGAGSKILVLPPSGAIEWLFDDQDWLDRTLAEINQHTDRPVVVRRKPTEGRVDAEGRFLGLFDNVESSNAPLGDELADTYCVVAHNSTATLAATAAGVPVITAAPNCCRPIGFRFEDLETARLKDEPERLELFHWLAHNQFNFDELGSEKAWLKLNV